MRHLILSDIHANWQALEAVLASAANEYESIVCCGDVVGYNAQPALVLEWLRQNCFTIVRGNHDKVISGLENLDQFTELAYAAAVWTKGQLDPEQMQYLRSLPQGPLLHESFEIWHGSYGDEDEYVTSRQEAAPYFQGMKTQLGFFGHTHLQGGFFSKAGRYGTIPKVPKEYAESVLELQPDLLYMVNPGSVGQPRDNDARAAYAIYDSSEHLIRLRRVDYAVMQTAQEVQQAGLPSALGIRLLVGR